MNKKLFWYLDGGYDPGYQAILARAATAGYATTGVDQAKQNTLYKALSTVLPSLNLLYIFKNGGSAQDFTRLNWADSSFDADYPTAITYNSSGVAGNGVDQYISTNFNCSTNGGGKYALNSACRGFWSVSPGASPTLDGTITTGSRNCMRAQSSTTVHKINQGSGNLASALDFTATNDYVALDREDASNVHGFNAGVKTSTTVASVSVLSEEQVIFRTGATYGNSTIGAYFLGAHLTDTQHATLRAALAAYMA